MTSSTQPGDEMEWLQKVKARLAAKKQHRLPRVEDERNPLPKPQEEPKSDNPDGTPPV